MWNCWVNLTLSLNLEGHTLSEDSGLGKTRMIKYSTAATGKESFVFSSPEKLLHLEKSEPHAAGNQEREEVESAFFTRFETCLLLGESARDILGEQFFLKFSSISYGVIFKFMFCLKLL